MNTSLAHLTKDQIWSNKKGECSKHGSDVP